MIRTLQLAVALLMFASFLVDTVLPRAVTSGLSHTDFHSLESLSGTFPGEFYNPVPPYQIPYGVLLPQKVSNLLIPVAASSSHVGFCALRLEPIWTSLGQAAGHAAVIAIEQQQAVQDVAIGTLQLRLHSDGSATIYVSDVLPGSEHFAAVQWWGTAGGLHGLHPMPANPGQRGRNLHGQYFEANPGHAAVLSTPLDEALAPTSSLLPTHIKQTAIDQPIRSPLSLFRLLCDTLIHRMLLNSSTDNPACRIIARNVPLATSL